jgi:hypothetical protein
VTHYNKAFAAFFCSFFSALAAYGALKWDSPMLVVYGVSIAVTTAAVYWIPNSPKGK